MSWVKLDDSFPDHPKVVGLSASAKWAYIEGLCYCARYLTDGNLPLGKARELGNKSVREELFGVGLWELDPQQGIMVHDYLEYNPSRAEVMRERTERHEAKSRAGRIGAARRWQGDSTEIADVWQDDGKPMAPAPTRTPYKKPPVEEETLIPRRNIFVLYDNYMGRPSVTGMMRDVLVRAEEDYPDECIMHCFEVAAKASDGRRSWKYVESILKRHQAEGCDARKPVGGHTNGAAAFGDSATELARYGPLPVYSPDC